MARKIYLLFFICTLATTSAKTQDLNLVPNWDFSVADSCPYLVGVMEFCANWYASIQDPALIGEWNYNPTPDYFHVCGDTLLSVPNNAAGFQKPCSGYGYVGIVSYSSSPNSIGYREIAGVALSEPLTPTAEYLVEFSCVRASKWGTGLFKHASNNLGVKFTTYENFLSRDEAVNDWAHFKIDSIITDTVNWLTVSFLFTADSAYRYLHIGNFFTDSQIEIVTFNTGTMRNSYYLIDCVNVSLLSGLNISSMKEELVISAEPNPFGNFISLEIPVSGSIEILDSMGRNLYRRNFTDKSTYQISTEGLSSGFYVLNFRTTDGRSVSKKLLKSLP